MITSDTCGASRVELGSGFARADSAAVGQVVEVLSCVAGYADAGVAVEGRARYATWQSWARLAHIFRGVVVAVEAGNALVWRGADLTSDTAARAFVTLKEVTGITIRASSRRAALLAGRIACVAFRAGDVEAIDAGHAVGHSPGASQAGRSAYERSANPVLNSVACGTIRARSGGCAGCASRGTGGAGPSSGVREVLASDAAEAEGGTGACQARGDAVRAYSSHSGTVLA